MAGFIAMACYGALSTALSNAFVGPTLVSGTTASATLLKAALPVAIGAAVIIGIVMVIAYFGNKRR